MSDQPLKNPQSFLPPDVVEALRTHFITNKGAITASSRQGRMAYFSKDYADRVKEIFDSILSTRQPVKILTTEHVSVYTLRQQYYEGKRYLVKHMDPTGIYANASASIKCITTNDYIEIMPKFTMRNALMTSPSIVEDTNWRRELAEWLDTDHELEEKFSRKNVLLSPLDIQWCNEQLIGIEPLYLAKFTQNEILVVRYDNSDGTK